MSRVNILFSSLCIVWILALSSCSQKGSNSFIEVPTRDEQETLEKPYLILISLDGFRWDYVDRFEPPNLSSFIKNGVKAESLIPSFPSKTFPNHYTIATGMFPDKHGLLGNLFYSHKKDQIYNIRDREKVEDGTFYGGTPIWVQAAKSGITTASYFFVGTEANIQGIHPDYYYRFDGSIKNQVRVNQVLNWLKMPENKRPHLITMYFADLDNTGHAYGPNADELLKKTLFALDKHLGTLFNGIQDTKLPVNIIIVSDHGMQEVDIDHFIPVELILNDDLFLAVNKGTMVNVHPKNEMLTDSIYQYLKEKEEHFKVFKTEDAPYFEYSPLNEDWGAIQILPDKGYYFMTQRLIGLKKSSSQTVFGQHGYDPDMKEMHGIFYANGPAFKKGYTIPSFKNIHIYPLMCEILGLDVPKEVDGKIDQIKAVLQNH